MKNKTGAIDEANIIKVAEALASMKAASDVRRFLSEICTDSECRDIALRWHLMKKLSEGVPQRAIAKELGLSLCKITRGSKYMKNDASIFRQLVLKAMKKLR